MGHQDRQLGKDAAKGNMHRHTLDGTLHEGIQSGGKIPIAGATFHPYMGIGGGKGLALAPPSLGTWKYGS